MKKLSHLLIALSAIVLSSFTLFAGCDDNDNNSVPATSSESVEAGPDIDGWDDI